jgi:hypothetical protein
VYIRAIDGTRNAVSTDKPKPHIDNPMKRKVVISLGMAAVAIGLGAIQAQGVSFTFNFADNTSDGWVNGGFASSPAASVVSIAVSRPFSPASTLRFKPPY